MIDFGFTFEGRWVWIGFLGEFGMLITDPDWRNRDERDMMFEISTSS